MGETCATTGRIRVQGWRSAVCESDCVRLRLEQTWLARCANLQLGEAWSIGMQELDGAASVTSTHK